MHREEPDGDEAPPSAASPGPLQSPDAPPLSAQGLAGGRAGLGVRGVLAERRSASSFNAGAAPDTATAEARGEGGARSFARGTALQARVEGSSLARRRWRQLLFKVVRLTSALLHGPAQERAEILAREKISRLLQQHQAAKARGGSVRRCLFQCLLLLGRSVYGLGRASRCSDCRQQRNGRVLSAPQLGVIPPVLFSAHRHAVLSPAGCVSECGVARCEGRRQGRGAAAEGAAGGRGHGCRGGIGDGAGAEEGVKNSAAPFPCAEFSD